MSIIIALLLLCLVLAIPQAREVLGGLIVLAVTLVLLLIGFTALLAIAALVAGALYYVLVDYGVSGAAAGWTAVTVAVGAIAVLTSQLWREICR